jgi:hypothetical protein
LHPAVSIQVFYYLSLSMKPLLHFTSLTHPPYFDSGSGSKRRFSGCLHLFWGCCFFFLEIVELFLCLNMQQIFATERLRGQQSKYWNMVIVNTLLTMVRCQASRVKKPDKSTPQINRESILLSSTRGHKGQNCELSLGYWHHHPVNICTTLVLVGYILWKQCMKVTCHFLYTGIHTHETGMCPLHRSSISGVFS